MIGDQIKNLRLAYNLNQVELAHKLSVSKQTVSNWENNNIMPSIDMLKKICSFFSCSADYILELEDNPHYINVTDLTLDQIAHLQRIIQDFQNLNRKINS